MTSKTSLTIKWADGTYTFRLAWGELVQLQNKLDAGPQFIFRNLMTDDWKVEYISEVIRLGLIGGGKTPKEASDLIEYYVTSRPPMENLAIAQGVLSYALIGDNSDIEGESVAASEVKE